MKLSIIIPVYNVEQYLQSCVQSVITQTYQDLQVILVDDGSTDSSGILCDQLAQQDSRMQVVHKENGGLSDARNAGLKVATGDYVAFLDSDDVYLLNDGLEQLMALAQAEQPDVLLFQAVDVYPNHQSVRKAYDLEYMATHSGVEVFAQLVRTQSFNMSACFQLIRRDLLEQYQIYFQKGLLSEDVDWSLRLWRHVSKVRAMNLPLYGYQHREGSISTTYTTRYLHSYERIFAKFVQLYKGRAVEAAAELYWQTVMGYLAQMYTSCLYAYGQIARKDRSEAYAILKRYATLLEHSISIKSDRVIKYKRVIGLRMTVWLFAVYGNIRRYRRRV
jgi:glycosyltransferase involved in cell wall biosynthesis